MNVIMIISHITVIHFVASLLIYLIATINHVNGEMTFCPYRKVLFRNILIRPELKKYISLKKLFG